MRTVRQDAPERVRLHSPERSRVIDELMGKSVTTDSKYQRRKIADTSAVEECATCHWRTTASDSGARMTGHINREHGGVGRSSLVL